MTNIVGYNSYITYVALKTHFKNEKYNYFRHRGAKITEGSLKRHRDRYWFIKLDEKYSEEDLLNFFLSQFTSNHLHQYWVGDSFGDACQEIYTKYKKKLANFTRTVGLEMQYLYETYSVAEMYNTPQIGYPKIINAYLGDRVSLETLIVLDELNGWVANSGALVGIVGAPLDRLIRKYRPFLNYDITPIRKKYKNLLEE
jgi:hypothetical protein